MPKLGKLQLEQITAPVVFELLLSLQNEGKLPTLKRSLMRLNEILELAVCAGLLEHNPCRKLSRAFSQHQPINRPFIPANRLHEMFALLLDKPLWFHCYVLFAVYSMLRPVECSSVKWSWLEDAVLLKQTFFCHFKGDENGRSHVPLIFCYLQCNEQTKRGFTTSRSSSNYTQSTRS